MPGGRPDFYNDAEVVEIEFDVNKTATFHSKYIDLQGYEEVTFLVRQAANTASAGNTFTLTVEVAQDTPGTIASYSAADSNEVQGSFTVHTSTGDKAPELVTLNVYADERYAKILGTEAGTADGDFTIYAIVSKGRHRPITGDTLTTGTVT